jgi:hypothetical protein
MGPVVYDFLAISRDIISLCCFWIVITFNTPLTSPFDIPRTAHMLLRKKKKQNYMHDNVEQEASIKVVDFMILGVEVLPAKMGQN